MVTPFALLESVWKFVPKFRNRQQQDAQEFLCYLFDRLQLELQHANGAMRNDPVPSATTPAANGTKSKAKTPTSTERRKRGDIEFPAEPVPPPPLTSDQATIITETFQGKLLSEVFLSLYLLSIVDLDIQVVCSSCKHRSTKLDPFLGIPTIGDVSQF